MHEIWIEQCDAAQDIKLRYWLKAAFDYVVAEKLLNFASAATQHPEFARELPRFVYDELIADGPVAAAPRAQQFATIKELLTASELGTS
jgi:hypothetical protein